MSEIGVFWLCLIVVCFGVGLACGVLRRLITLGVDVILFIRWNVRPVIAWYDCWIGVYWDRAKRRLYVLPLPCLGVVVDFGVPPERPRRAYSGLLILPGEEGGCLRLVASRKS